MDNITLQDIRQQIYTCFERAGDALFNLVDALVSESQAQSLPELSFSAFFERKWPSVYEALEDGRINGKQLRAVLVKTLLAQRGDNERICIALDTSHIERADAKTSEDRGIIHLSNLPLVDKPLSVGWQVSSVVMLPDSPSSWTPTLDQRRIKTKETPIQVAIAQLRSLRPLFGNRRVIVVADRGYCTPEFLRACQQLNSSVLVRLKSDRKLYRPGVRIHKRGPVPKDGPLLQGKRKETHGQPNALCLQEDSKGRSVRISRWDDLHFQQDRLLNLKVICVEREAAKGSKRDPRLSWFVMLDEIIPLSQIPELYALRFSQEHNYRFLKQKLLWTDVHVRTPEQFERWSWLVAIAFDLLFLAQDLAQVLHRPWEPKSRPVTPQQVRRVMPAILLHLGTPAKLCQPRGKSPGRAKGFRPQPAQRFQVICKHPKKPKKPKEPLQPTR
jgi:DDE superfamily endonuclease